MQCTLTNYKEPRQLSIMVSHTTNVKVMDTMDMAAARIHSYCSPLVLEDITSPKVTHSEEVLVRVGAAGLCHSDLHLINGDWKKSLPIGLPKIPGHEVSGWVEEVGTSVPKNLLQKGDLVAVFGGWGCGTCVYCKRGDEQLCISPNWPGLSQYDGGFSEYILVPSYRFLVKVNGKKLTPQEVAPLTDAGLTPYRAIKKIRHLLVAGKSIAILGVGGLGSYAIQYAKLFGSGANVVALDRREDKLELANELGADFSVNIEWSSDPAAEIRRITSENGFDVVLDTVGLDITLKMAFRTLNKSGALVLVGLFGHEINAPLFSTVIREYQIYGSLWGSYNELREVIEVANKGLIKHNIQKFPLSKVNDAIEDLHECNILGRAVIVP